MKNIRKILIFSLAALVYSGCEEMDYKYRDFVEGGPIIYINKPVGVEFRPGKERVELAFLCPDPKVKYLDVTWRNGDMSQTFDLVPSKDTMEVMIENLDEGDYTFNLKTRDAEGNSSIGVEIQGKVYGKYFANSIKPREFYSFDPDKSNFVMARDVSGSIDKTMITYHLTGSEETATVELPGIMQEIKLENCDPDRPIVYYSIHKPDPKAIDSFLSPKKQVVSKYTEVIVGSQPGEASKLVAHYLFPGDDIGRPGSSSPNNPTPFMNCFDGSTITYYSSSIDQGLNNGTGNIYVTIDMLDSYKLSGCRMWGRFDQGTQFYYHSLSPVKWTIFGATGDESGFSEGDESAWTKLAEGEMASPDDTTWPNLSDAAKAQYVQGFYTEITAENPYRYVRFHFPQTYSDPAVGLSEVNLYYYDVTYVVEEYIED